MRYHLRCLVTALFLVAASFSLRASELIPVEEFARLPVVSNPKLSPDGRRVAMTIVSKGRPLVVTQPLDSALKEQGVGSISLGDLYISDYYWGNNERLILAARTAKRSPVFKGLVNFTRLLIVDWDGKNPVPLHMEPNQWGVYRQHPSILHPLPDDDQHILALLDDRKDDWFLPHVHKVDLYTGEKTFHQLNTRRIQYWFSDRQGNVLVGSKTDTHGSAGTQTYYRPDMDSEWRLLQKADYFDHDRLIPFRFDDTRPNILLLSTRELLEENSWRTVDETESKLFEYDLNLGEITGEYKNLQLANVKNQLQAAMPDMSLVLESVDANKENYIFGAFSDTRQTTYYLVNVKKGSIQRLGREYPALDGKPLANTKVIEYPARDGLTIPAFLTLPRVATQLDLPLIVYPHGGPWANDEWGFDPWVQFFASRGYAVLQPQYRGSTGYGIEHEEAGYKKWGAEMQDDITDGVLHLVENGIVDKTRICIVGASYGGYAAAWGLIKDPGLYQCGISINGVLSMTKNAGELGSLLFGDLNRQLFNDNDDLARFSPSYRAGEVESPLLLIASKKDTVVPYTHSRNMYKKMKKLDKEVEYLELKDGEHWRTNEANEIKILKAVDRFLQKHLPTEIHHATNKTTDTKKAS